MSERRSVSCSKMIKILILFFRCAVYESTGSGIRKYQL